MHTRSSGVSTGASGLTQNFLLRSSIDGRLFVFVRADGSLVLQGKSSCFPAHMLLADGGSLLRCTKGSSLCQLLAIDPSPSPSHFLANKWLQLELDNTRRPLVVVDACAAPGNKTSHAAALLHGLWERGQSTCVNDTRAMCAISECHLARNACSRTQCSGVKGRRCGSESTVSAGACCKPLTVRRIDTSSCAPACS